MSKSNCRVERDLPVHLRNLVDTCFEEGQYEAAIVVLDEVRGQGHKPFPPHIRQLIYIALYPPPSVEDQAEDEAITGSPCKNLSKKHASSLTPTVKASAAAQDLLMKFALGNSPGALACALPSYPENPNVPLDASLDDGDSDIAQRALRVRDARCCWEILKAGFIERGDRDAAPSPFKPQLRRSRRGYDMSDEEEEVDTVVLAPVSEHGWPVLAWMLKLFERDETAMEQTGETRYSPLLLKQIPSSGPNNSTRWNVEMPLRIAFHALEQEQDRHRHLGIRLLTLLINLTSTTLIDLPMFLKAISTYVSSLSVDGLTYLFQSLPATRPVGQIKLLVCRDALGGGSGAHSSTTVGPGRPKPHARARALPRRRARADSAVGTPDATTLEANGVAPAAVQPAGETGLGANGSGKPSTGGPPSVARKFPSIPASEVLALLARPAKSDAASVLLQLCFKAELVLGYGCLQQTLAEKEKDDGWPGVVRGGELRKVIEGAFDIPQGKGASRLKQQSVKSIKAQRDDLLAIVTIWEASV